MEQWKDVSGYEGFYQISTLGRVKSLSRKVKGRHNCIRETKEKILNPHTVKDGYSMVELMTNGRSTRKNHLVHRLVLENFVGKSELECNHINKIRNDNRLENLEYVTRAENVNRGESHWRFGKKFEYKKRNRRHK